MNSLKLKQEIYRFWSNRYEEYRYILLKDATCCSDDILKDFRNHFPKYTVGLTDQSSSSIQISFNGENYIYIDYDCEIYFMDKSMREMKFYPNDQTYIDSGNGFCAISTFNKIHGLELPSNFLDWEDEDAVMLKMIS